jgi:hypothetical protein
VISAARAYRRGARDLFVYAEAPNLVIWGGCALAFTIAPHLQTINYHGRFSSFAGI